jgi:hypothetical protein
MPKVTKLPKMPKIKETLRPIYFIDLTEYHNFSSFLSAVSLEG